MSESAGVEVTIRIDPSNREVFDDIVARLVSAGLVNVEPRPRFLIVSGTIDTTALDSLRRIEGVASVEAASTFRAI